MPRKYFISGHDRLLSLLFQFITDESFCSSVIDSALNKPQVTFWASVTYSHYWVFHAWVCIHVWEYVRNKQRHESVCVCVCVCVCVKIYLCTNETRQKERVTIIRIIHSTALIISAEIFMLFCTFLAYNIVWSLAWHIQYGLFVIAYTSKMNCVISTCLTFCLLFIKLLWIQGFFLSLRIAH